MHVLRYTIAVLFLFYIPANARRWVELGMIITPPYNDPVLGLCTDPDGNVYATSSWTGEHHDRNYVVKWDGSQWSELIDEDNLIPDYVQIFRLYSGPDGAIYAAGYFPFVAKWDGTSWSKVGGDSDFFNGSEIMNVLSFDVSGNLYAAGFLLDENRKQYVAKWDGTEWTQLGTGTAAFNQVGDIWSMCTDPSGNVYVSGDFTNEEGDHYVAQWNGSNWIELSTANSAVKFMNQLSSLCSDQSGNIYTCSAGNATIGGYCVAKWNGSEWSPLGNLRNPLRVHADANGNVYAINTTSGDAPSSFVNDIMKWDGFAWQDLGNARVGQIRDMCSDANGNLYIGGDLETYNIAKFDRYATAVKDHVFASSLSFYPNPTSSLTTMETQESGLLKVYSALCKLLFTQVVEIGTVAVRLDQ